MVSLHQPKTSRPYSTLSSNIELGSFKLAHFLGVFAKNGDIGDFVQKVNKSRDHGMHEICVLNHLQSTLETSHHVAPLLGSCSIDSRQVLVFQDIGQPLTQDEWTKPLVDNAIGMNALHSAEYFLHDLEFQHKMLVTICGILTWHIGTCQLYSGQSNLPENLSTHPGSTVGQCLGRLAPAGCQCCSCPAAGQHDVKFPRWTAGG